MGVPHKQKIVSLYNVFFNEILSSEFVYTSQQCAEEMAMRSALSCIPYATYSMEQTGDIITFTSFEEGGLLSETSKDTKAVRNLMTVQLLHHYLVKKKLIQFHQAMILLLNLCLRIR